MSHESGVTHEESRKNMAFQGSKKYQVLPTIIASIILLLLAIIDVAAEPVATFQESFWNFGEIQYGESVSREFEITNTGQDELKISKIQPLCVCIRGEIIKDTAISGASAKIKVIFTALPEFANDVNIFCYVHTSDKNTPLLKISVQGKIKSLNGTDASEEFRIKPNEILVFYSPSANNYSEIKALLDKLKEKQATIVREYPLSEENYVLLAKYEQFYNLAKHGPVEIFAHMPFKAYLPMDVVALSDSKEIIKYLNANLEDIKPKPQILPANSQKLQILFFYSIMCKECKKILYELLPELEDQYKNQLQISKYDIGVEENYLKLITLEKKYGVTENEPLIVFVGDKRYLSGGKDIAQNIAVVIQESLADLQQGDSPDIDIKANKLELVKEYESYGTLSVISAGLADGINPCAFATIVFLVSFLGFLGKSRREILVIGVFYTFAVFVTYFLLGLGVFHVLQKLAIYDSVSRIVFYFGIALCFGFALFSLYDMVVYLKTRQSRELLLQLPMGVKQRIHNVIRNHMKTSGLIIGALIIGFLVSLFEAICTGGMYLPTLMLVLKLPELRVNAFSNLFLYNLMFIVPLIVVFALAFYGVGSKRLESFAKNNLVTTKFLLFLVFTGMGILLLL